MNVGLAIHYGGMLAFLLGVAAALRELADAERARTAPHLGDLARIASARHRSDPSAPSTPGGVWRQAWESTDVGFIEHETTLTKAENSKLMTFLNRYEDPVEERKRFKQGRRRVKTTPAP